MKPFIAKRAGKWMCLIPQGAFYFEALDEACSLAQRFILARRAAGIGN